MEKEKEITKEKMIKDFAEKVMETEDEKKLDTIMKMTAGYIAGIKTLLDAV